MTGSSSRADTGDVQALALLVALVAGQLTTLQQPSPGRPAEGTTQASALVEAAEAAKAQQATRARIAALTREADVLKKQATSVLGELRQLDVERDLQQARAVQARQARALIDIDIAGLVTRSEALQATLDRERPAVAARLRRLQRLGRVGYARIAWDAPTARSVGRAARLMNYLAKDDGRRLQAYLTTAESLRDTRTRLSARRTEAQALEQEARARRAAADMAYARKQELLATLEAETTQRERWLAELVAARARLDATAASLPAATSAAATPRVPLVSRRRQLEWPVAGSVLQRFGRQRDPKFGTSTLNNGIAIGSASGTPVRALHPGSVAFAGPFTGFGQLVIVDHGQQSYSLYGYLSTITVQRGTVVDTSSVIGEVGATPDGTPALYLELRVDGRPVNPLEWLDTP